MPDFIDAAFDRMRQEVSSSVVAPEAAQIIRRSRHRRNVRFAAVGAAAAVAVAGTFAVQAVRAPSRHVVGPVSPSASAPSAPASAPAGRPVRVGDLVYAAVARTNAGRHWTINSYRAPDGSYSMPNVPGCGPNGRPELDLTGLAYGYEVAYEANPAGEKDAAGPFRGEQVFVFGDAAAAQREMAKIISAAEECRKQRATVNRPTIGQQAVSASWSYNNLDSQGDQIELAAGFRQGNVIAVYWNAGTRPLVTVAQLERDARTMAQRLCKLGYGC